LNRRKRSLQLFEYCVTEVARRPERVEGRDRENGEQV
jgi:hypothetical protein